MHIAHTFYGMMIGMSVVQSESIMQFVALVLVFSIPYMFYLTSEEKKLDKYEIKTFKSDTGLEMTYIINGHGNIAQIQINNK